MAFAEAACATGVETRAKIPAATAREERTRGIIVGSNHARRPFVHSVAQMGAGGQTRPSPLTFGFAPASAN